MTQHQTNSTHTWTLPSFSYKKYTQIFHSLPFIYFFVLFRFASQVPLSALSGFAHSPILGACSWNGFNSSFDCPQGFLFSSSPWLLDFWLIHCLRFQSLPPPADPLPADLSIIELVVLLWLSSLPRTASSLRPFLPCGPWMGCFLWGRPRLSPFLRRGCLLPSLPVLFVEPSPHSQFPTSPSSLISFWNPPPLMHATCRFGFCRK